MKNSKLWRYYVGAAIMVMLSFSIASAQNTISRQLSIGSRGADVTTLQNFLATDKTIYPEGLVTGYYGTLTARAVSRFQSANGLPAVSRVGPLTLAKINGIISSGGVSGTDITAPTMFSLSISTTTNSANISWTTNENARSKVFYNTTPMVTTEATQNFTEPTIVGTVVADNTLKTTANINITGLQANTRYYYRAEAMDQTGNVTVTPELTFVTGTSTTGSASTSMTTTVTGSSTGGTGGTGGGSGY